MKNVFTSLLGVFLCSVPLYSEPVPTGSPATFCIIVRVNCSRIKPGSMVNAYSPRGQGSGKKEANPEGQKFCFTSPTQAGEVKIEITDPSGQFVLVKYIPVSANQNGTEIIDITCKDLLDYQNEVKEFRRRAELEYHRRQNLDTRE